MKTLKKVKIKTVKNGKPLTDIIAYRKACNVQGTGLSHYILMDKKTK